MKTIILILTTLLFTFAAIPSLHSQGYIVPNGVTYVGYTSGMGYRIRVQNPNSLIGYSEFSLNPVGGNMYDYSSMLDVSVRAFFVDPPDPVSQQAIQSQVYTELTLQNSYYLPLNTPFYVGFYTGMNPTGGIYPNPVFGWAELENVNGSIQLLDSALEYGGGGIYTGTQTIIVPEPGILSLLSLGGLFLGWRWRKSSR